MARVATFPLGRLESWIGLAADASATDRLRVRLICITCLCFMAMEIICFAGAYWAFGGLVRQHAVIALSFVGKSYLILLLRFTRKPSVLGWAFSTSSILGIWIAAGIDHMGQSGTFEIGAAYTPFMIVSLVFVSLIGTRNTTLYYTVLCLGTLVAFFVLGSLFVYENGMSPQGKLGLVLRCTSIFLTTTLMIPVSRIIYGTLDDLSESVARAGRAEAKRKELLATMSHEIRTPLNGIISVSDLLEKREHDTTTKTHLNIISVSAGNLLEIVNEQLGQARSEHLGEADAEAPEVATEPFSPSELLEQSRALFAAHAQQKGLWIGTHGLDTLPGTLLGDAGRLRQVMNNLVGNAIKFTHAGGVRLGARTVGGTDTSARLQFFVQDTGVGIEAEAIDAVFERFGQSASSLTSHDEGTGLGLAICNELVTAMGGKMRVSSRVGAGSTFYFELCLPKMINNASHFAA